MQGCAEQRVNMFYPHGNKSILVMYVFYKPEAEFLNPSLGFHGNLMETMNPFSQ